MRKRSVFLAAALAATTVGSFASPAAATNQQCKGITSTAQSVGVLGEEVAEVPALYLWVCAELPDGVTTFPSLEVSLTPARVVHLVHPDADYERFKIYVSALVGDDVEDLVYHQVVLPIPADGGKTCLFFQGWEDYNPGGCAIFVEGNSTVGQTINETLDDLPLP